MFCIEFKTTWYKRLYRVLLKKSSPLSILPRVIPEKNLNYTLSHYINQICSIITGGRVFEI